MLEILTFPDPRLYEKSVPVERFDAELHRLLDGMAEAMYRANGVGLAAPQVGRLLRLFVIDIGSESDKKLREFVNPAIVEAQGKAVFEEGCLSVPGFAEKVQRKGEIVVRFQDRYGKQEELRAEGLLAVAIQHENDHLDGILFIDRLAPLKRKMVKRKLEKVATL